MNGSPDVLHHSLRVRPGYYSVRRPCVAVRDRFQLVRHQSWAVRRPDSGVRLVGGRWRQDAGRWWNGAERFRAMQIAFAPMQIASAPMPTVRGQVKLARPRMQMRRVRTSGPSAAISSLEPARREGDTLVPPVASLGQLGQWHRGQECPRHGGFMGRMQMDQAPGLHPETMQEVSKERTTMSRRRQPTVRGGNRFDLGGVEPCLHPPPSVDPSGYSRSGAARAGRRGQAPPQDLGSETGPLTKLQQLLFCA
jgi:hypothetical protein